MKLLMVVVTIWFTIGTTSSLTYPTFGIKRYHRRAAPQGSEMAQHIVKQPVYESGYLTNNGYYYFPHHEYHSYGLPTYRGEYKPKAYYYSSGPSFNYYNDKQPVSNPLDDLHEEILQENEQERQTDSLGKDNYEDDDYYIDPNEKTHYAETTSNFLRNMMEYNRQKEKQQRLQQLYYQQNEQLNQQMQAEQDHPNDDDEYFSEIDVNPDDYQFEPKGEDSFDLQKYWDAERSSMNKGATSADIHYQKVPGSRLSNIVQDAQELKSFSKNEPDNYDEDNKKRYRNTVKQSPLNNPWIHAKTTEPSFTQHNTDLEDDYSAVDYDDGSWINWDRKRSSIPNKNRAIKILKADSKQESSRQSNTQHESLESTSKSSIVLPSKAYGQKEKYPVEEYKAQLILDQTNEDNLNSNKQYSKSASGPEQSIYDTIKKMITIEEELIKNGSKAKNKNIDTYGNVVKQLDSLRKIKN